MIQSKVKHLETTIAERANVDTFSKCSQLLAPAFGILYVLECEVLEVAGVSERFAVAVVTNKRFINRRELSFCEPFDRS